MTQKELKIGDWVLVDGNPVMLDELPDDTLTFYNSETGFCKDYDYYDLRPVPLTKEILEKNGWIYYETQNYWEYTGKFEFTLVYSESKGFTIEQVPHKTFQSVHELQHILWALGVDDNMTIE